MKPKTIKAYNAACEETRTLQAAIAPVLTMKINVELSAHYKLLAAETMEIIVDAVTDFIYPFPEYPIQRRRVKPAWRSKGKRHD